MNCGIKLLKQIRRIWSANSHELRDLMIIHKFRHIWPYLPCMLKIEIGSGYMRILFLINTLVINFLMHLAIEPRIIWTSAMAKCIGIENQAVLLKLKARHFGPNSTYWFIWILKRLWTFHWLGSFLGLGHGGFSIEIINNVIQPIEGLAALACLA